MLERARRLPRGWCGNAVASAHTRRVIMRSIQPLPGRSSRLREVGGAGEGSSLSLSLSLLSLIHI
eukprot:1503930-Prorocentrum_lima.AAC.1